MKIVFPEKSIEAIYKRSKNLKEILSSASFSLTKNLIVDSISNYNKRSDICTSFLLFNNTFKGIATGKYNKVKIDSIL